MALLLNPVSSTLISRGEPSDLNPITPQIKVSKPVTYNGAILTTNCLIPQIGAANQAQSTFNDYSGISNNYDLYAPRKWEQDGTLDAVFQTLQINKENFQSWGGDYAPPDGSEKVHFSFWINVRDGMVIVDNAQTPQRNAKIPTGIPTRLSDVMFLAWANACSSASPRTSIRSLKYVLHRSVYNPYSEKIGGQAVTAAGSTLRQWPGTLLAVGTDPWKALMGCPNGFGVVLCLIQHQVAFQGRTVGAAKVFHDSTEQLCFLFSLTHGAPGGVIMVSSDPAARPLSITTSEAA